MKQQMELKLKKGKWNMQKQVSVKLFILLFLRYVNTSPAENTPDRCIWFFVTASFFSVQQPLDLFFFLWILQILIFHHTFTLVGLFLTFALGLFMYLCIYLFSSKSKYD